MSASMRLRKLKTPYFKGLIAVMNAMLSREHRRVPAIRWYSSCAGSSSKPAFFAEKPSRQVVHCGSRSPPYAFARPNNWRQRLKMTQAEIVCDDPQLGP